MFEESLEIPEINLELKNQSGVKIILFSHLEQKWIFSSQYTKTEEIKQRSSSGREKTMYKTPDPVLLVRTALSIEYSGGFAENKFDLSIYMKRLDKKGEHHTLGKDLTEGRYINSILTYIKNNSSDRDAYVLQQANLGSLGTRSINSNDDFKGLEAEISRFASHEIPIIDCVRKKDKDIYKAPFLDKQGTTSFFEFPSSLFSLKTIFD